LDVLDALHSLDQAHEALASVDIHEDTDDLFWADPFTPEGSELMRRLSPAARDIRLGAEHTLEALYRNRSKARVNSDTLGDMEVAAWRFDTLGMKVQFTEEINKFYWDAFQNQTDDDRVGSDLEEITAINARLEDLRDSTTRVREMYRKAWFEEDRPYWLDNVLVRYDNLAREFQAKIVAVRQARRQYYATKALTPPKELGFYLEP
jgi:hexosaminidase